MLLIVFSSFVENIKSKFKKEQLKNYIHQYFINESLGSKLNMEGEQIQKQNRNSFNWFEFGLDKE